MIALKQIIIKKLSNSSSCIEDFYFPDNTFDDTILDTNYIISVLEKSYVKFNKLTETYFSINGKRENITLNDLKSGLVIIIKILNVKSQYDNPYNCISNQCSWISKEFVLNKVAIINAIENNNHNLLLQIYNNCMLNGTNNRIQHNSKVEGENIDEINLNVELKTTIYGDMTMLYLFGQEIINKIYKPSLEINDYNNFLNEIKNMQNNNMMILNRDGQSFCFLKMNDTYIVLDSHIRNIHFYNFNQLVNYILENNPDGFFYIIYGIVS